MTTRRDLLMGGAAAGIAAAAGLQGCERDYGLSNAGLGRLLEGFANELLAEYPENATFLGLEKGSHKALKSQLADRSADGDLRRAASCRDRLARLRTFDRKTLTGEDAVNYDAVLAAHELAGEGYDRFHFGDNAVLNTLQAESNTPYVINQGSGDFAVVPDFLDSQHAIETKSDADAYLARMSSLAEQLDGETGRVRRDAGAGVVPPDFLLDLTLKQMADFRARPVAEWGLVSSLRRRTNAKHISGPWETSAHRICETQLTQALDRQMQVLKDLRTRAGHDAGVWRLPGGEAYYDWLLKVGTTTTLTAEEVHQIGLDQVRDLDAQMDQLLRKQGLSQGTVGARMSALSKDPRFLFPDTDEGRAQLLAYLNGRVEAVRRRMPDAFHTLQDAKLVIRRVPVEIQAGAANGYEQDGSMDGKRPATYYINLRDMGMWPKFSLPTLTFHEGIPGHVWQGRYVHKLPTIRSLLVFNAYVEGWGLYAEQLADELGMYADDPFGRLGYLQSLQFRACRLVVDTGLHAMRWSREQAIAWLVEHNGSPEEKARSEVDRYCAWPGQACGYTIGHTELNKLRAKAKAALGAKFDLKGFNDALVLSGSMPLTVLDGVVDHWIAARR
jgi:uncharacterized protein (DUF885 family)